MPLKILFLSHGFNPDIGGIEVNSELLAHAFTAAGHDVRLLTWTSTPSAQQFPFPVIRNPSKQTLFKEHTWANVVFENNPCVRLAWPGLFFGRASVISLNTDLSWADDGVRWLKLALLRRARSVIAVSDAVRRKCWPAAAVIGNPYRADEFKLLPHIPRTDNFVFVGRLVSQKGADLAVRGFHRLLQLLARREPRAQQPLLTIIGDGPERPRLEQLVTTLELQHQVQFTGFLHGQELAEELNRHRFLLVPSLYGEAFGNVVLEGMACGCLPIVSDSDGLPASAGPAGLVFRRGSDEALADGIWRLLHSPELEHKLREAAAAHLAAHLPEVVSSRYLQVIEAAVRKK